MLAEYLDEPLDDDLDDRIARVTGSMDSTSFTRALKSARDDTPSQVKSLSHPTVLMIWQTICTSPRKERVRESEIGSVLDFRKLLPSPTRAFR